MSYYKEGISAETGRGATKKREPTALPIPSWRGPHPIPVSAEIPSSGKLPPYNMTTFGQARAKATMAVSCHGGASAARVGCWAISRGVIFGFGPRACAVRAPKWPRSSRHLPRTLVLINMTSAASAVWAAEGGCQLQWVGGGGWDAMPWGPAGRGVAPRGLLV